MFDLKNYNTDDLRIKIYDLTNGKENGNELLENFDELVQQHFIECRNNEMLITECEDLKSAVVVAEEQRDRLQANLIDKEEVNAELRQTIIALHQRQIKLENMLADHQELSQWIEEQIDNEPDTRIFEVSHDFLEILYDKVHKINH